MEIDVLYDTVVLVFFDHEASFLDIYELAWEVSPFIIIIYVLVLNIPKDPFIFFFFDISFLMTVVIISPTEEIDFI